MRRLRPLVLVVVLAGCLGTGPSGPTPTTTTTPVTPAPAPANVSLVVDANAGFGLRVLAELAREHPGANLVASPYSLSVALAMAMDGAQGATRDAMARTLGLPADDPDALNAAFHALLLNSTSRDPNVTLNVANSAWLDSTFGPQVSQAYLRDVTQQYASELRVEDFRSPNAAKDINAWASNKTQGKIPKVVDAILDREILFLVNAVYLKAPWSQPFSPRCTHPAAFTREDGSVVQAPVLCGMPTSKPRFVESPNLTTVRVPYGDDGHLALYLLMPTNGATVGSTLASLSAESLDATLANATGREVDLALPKLALANHFDLQPALTQMGMGLAFSDSADFGRIAPGLAISRVTHDAMLQADENGTVAAAVTIVGVGTTSAPPPPTKIAIDHPFLFVLRDDASGSVLFLGIVRDPTATG